TGFDRLINRPDIDPYFQPLVALSDSSTIGYEVLVRSRIKGLETPDKIFRIAALRLSEARLSEVCRMEGLLSGIQIDPNGCFFLNTHARELETPRLFSSLADLRDCYPNVRVVLEVHEAAITSVRYLQELTVVLRDLNIDLAFDDFGAGQARLVELFVVPPKYLKFDISFVRGLENASKPHKTSVRSLLKMVRDLEVISLAEGVETKNQVDVCTELGFDMAQGYYFGRPQPRQFWQSSPADGDDVTKSLATLRS
ncbi:MAG: EAL domain-containing protein, partial [Planctomycetaceae bacterium]|nr:EAL domain-containing protein [Planctomycetaceae bacterium]